MSRPRPGLNKLGRKLWKQKNDVLWGWRKHAQATDYGLFVSGGQLFGISKDVAPYNATFSIIGGELYTTEPPDEPPPHPMSISSGQLLVQE